MGDWTDASHAPELESKFEFSGTLYIGIGGELAFSLLHEKALTIAIEWQIGGELSGKEKVDSLSSGSGSSIHQCEICIAGELSGVFKIDLRSVVLGKKKDLLGYRWKKKVSDFFYCADEKEFGFTKCPHKVFRVELTAQDAGNGPVEDAWIRLFDSENNEITPVTLVDKDGAYTDDIPNTDAKGKTTFYLPNGEYTLEAIYAGSDQGRPAGRTGFHGSRGSQKAQCAAGYPKRRDHNADGSGDTDPGGRWPEPTAGALWKLPPGTGYYQRLHLELRPAKGCDCE